MIFDSHPNLGQQSETSVEEAIQEMSVLHPALQELAQQARKQTDESSRVGLEFLAGREQDRQIDSAYTSC
jgi:hypothetical protein